MSTLRRLFVLPLAVAFACAQPVPSQDKLQSDQLNANETRVRIMAANTTSGNFQSYDPGHGIRIFQGTSPDIVLIQEMSYGNDTPSDIRAFVDLAFGPSFYYYRESGAQIPNGVVSRYPILESGQWNDPYVSNRDFAWARIDIPGPIDLWAVSVHLKAKRSSTQNNEARAIVQYVEQNIPPGDYLVVGGDFNTSGRTSSAIGTFSQIVVTSGPYPVDQNGNGNTNRNRNKPYDWVLVDSQLNPLETSVEIGNSSFPNGLVVDTRVYRPLSEISPAQSGDSNSSNMQHQAVIRDFAIPNGGIAPDAGTPDSGTVIDAGTPDSGTTPDAGFPDSGTIDAGTPDSGSGGGTPLVYINEILANEPGSSTSGEFVEIVNVGDAAADMSGWTLSDGAATRHTFSGGTVLGAGEAIVVFGGASAIPPGLSNAVSASSGLLGLSNGGDTVTLRDGGVTVDSFQYSSSLSGTDGVSMNRDPDGDPTGTFVLHTSLAGSNSPGTMADGSSFGSETPPPPPPADPIVFINEILANEPGGSVSQEFVEIVNLGGAADLSGWTVSDGAATRHTFASGTILDQNEVIVVFGGSSGIVSGVNGVAASSGALGLSNGGDTVTLRDGGTTVDSFNYPSSLSGTDGVSMNRDPDADPAADFVLHTTLGANRSPGTRVDGSTF